MQKIWIFQALPDEYDLAEEVPLRKSNGDEWGPLYRHFRKMRIDDRVVLWQAGSEAGIYGFGWLKSDPYKKRKKWHVRIGYGPLLKAPIPRQELRGHPILRNLQLLSKAPGMARGMVFPVEENQWQALKKLIPRIAREGLSRVSDQLEETREKMDKAGRFSPMDMEDARKRQLAEIVVRQGQPQFREQLLDAYGGRCAVTGYNVIQALEGAHIVQYFGAKANVPDNGLLLRADVHTLFDLRLMAIHPTSYLVVVSKTLGGSSYRSYARKSLRRPMHKSERPSVQALEIAFKEFEDEESKR